MNDFTLDELSALLGVFEKAGVAEPDGMAGDLLRRLKEAHGERQELESMDFDDCLGGACKL
ncbi:hypothetical protein [Marinobacterium arenosum]|uniref:hypothetical protein n=1 Tax=Marinobacterium arenosum TaxID=2862496 RepID=UPI001C959AA1|nr:hypothetical protein [Marinobacterium arenosum]MBY4676155.1 hypothetical protein [Marinobacterium arenosum]